MKTTLVIFLLTALLGGYNTDIKLNPEKSSLQVLGTSSVHDWESEVNKFSIRGKLIDDKITNLDVQVQTESIKSGKSIMDDKTYEALEAKKHPVIRFSADQLSITGKKIKGSGTLSLAGKSKPIVIEANLLTMNEKEIQLEGVVNLRMSEFGIEPPTAMFGSLKTGDEVTIKYEIFLNNN